MNALLRCAATSDAFLVEECAEFVRLLASYVAGCDALEDFGSSPAASDEDIMDGQRRLADARLHWRWRLRRISTSPAHSGADLLAKAGAIEEYLRAHRVEDADAIALIGSLLSDLQRLLGNRSRVELRAGIPPQMPFAARAA